MYLSMFFVAPGKNLFLKRSFETETPSFFFAGMLAGKMENTCNQNLDLKRLEMHFILFAIMGSKVYLNEAKNRQV